MRNQRRKVLIVTGRNATSGAFTETRVTTLQRFDRQGRLQQVVEDEGGPLSQTTEYFYDVGDRLSRVKQVRAGVTQERLFNYDRRGFLLSEQHPEKGSLGNGLVQYFSYDPLGNPGRKADGPNDLTFTYDRAARLTQIRDTFGLQRAHKEFTYATASGFSDKRGGKLVLASRHNYFDDFGIDLVVSESFTYAGREGRVSIKGTSVSSGDSYSQSPTWNELGDLQNLTYPDCLHCPPGVEPTRTVSYGYTNGFLTSIPGWASSITYHPNGMIDRVTLQNGVAWTQGVDPNDMRRPASISVTRGTFPYFATGTYQYDGAGNVKAIGSDYFLYDRLGRLVEGTASGAGAGRRQTYQYDGFGNLTDITTWTTATTNIPRSVGTNPGTNRLSAAGYDSAGAMTSWGLFTYERDSLGMIQKLQGDGLDLRYAYTADDERFLEFDVNIFGSIWRLRDLGGQVIREIHLDNATDSWSWQKDWIRREGQPLASVDAIEGTRYLHADHLGTTRAISDSGGSHRTTFHFFPYGELAAKFGSSTEQMLFTGHERDDHNLAGSTGSTDDLDYMHARYYNPMLGRFLRVDPVEQGNNLYGYSLGNPLMFTDPFGLFPCPGLEQIECHDSITVIAQAPSDFDPFEQVILRIRLRDLREYLATQRMHFMERSISGEISPDLASLVTGTITAIEALLPQQDAFTPLDLSVEGVVAVIPGPADNAILATTRGTPVTGFTRHGLNQLISRDGVGVSDRAVLDALKNPSKVVSQSNNTIRYVGKDATVVLNSQGKIVTLWASSSSGTRAIR